MFVERQGVEENRAPDVRAVGCEPDVVLRVQLLRERGLLAFDCGHIAAQRGEELTKPEARRDFFPDRVETRINVMEVQRVRVLRPLLPEPANALAQYP